jgi:hypothetical protein
MNIKKKTENQNRHTAVGESTRQVGPACDWPTVPTGTQSKPKQQNWKLVYDVPQWLQQSTKKSELKIIIDIPLTVRSTFKQAPWFKNDE